ncbi:MAG TPA: hypothetical protein VFR91_09125 [Dyella sp.]|nr:hypothetical protein [Dyella sp.]
MKKLIFGVGLYFLLKGGVGTFHVVEHFSSWTFGTPYAAGLATGKIAAPLLFLVVGVLLIRHAWSAGSSGSKRLTTA